MYVFVRMCAHVYLCVHVHVCTCVYIHLCMCGIACGICMCMCMCMCVCVCMCVCARRSAEGGLARVPGRISDLASDGNITVVFEDGVGAPDVATENLTILSY